MTHLDEQNMLLYAYGEAAEAEARGMEEHLASCAACRGDLETIERGRVLAGLAFAPPAIRPPQILPVAAALIAAAATIAGIVLLRERQIEPRGALALSPSQWSSPAGYFASGPDLMAVDSILIRLEKEMSHVDR